MSKRVTGKRKARRRSAAACCGRLEDLLHPRFFKALCDPNRVALIVGLSKRRGSCSVGELSACCPTDLSVVSRHLAILRDAGILTAQKQGKQVHYTVRSGQLVKALRSIADAIEVCCPSPDAIGKEGKR